MFDAVDAMMDAVAEFDYRTATAPEIEARARGLVGRWLIDLDPSAPMVPSSATTKAIVGHIYERAFGIPRNSTAGPDFPGAGIELKSVPVFVVNGEPRAKERISISMIDFPALVGQSWDAASVRKKLDRMLMIFYGWEPLQPIARFRTLAAGIWTPDQSTLKTIRADWERIRDLVACGNRDQVSESLSTILGAATKGPGHGSRSRAWSLKQPFVGWLFKEMAGTEPGPTTSSAVDPAAAFESHILSELAPHVGMTFDRLANGVGRGGKGGKGAVATTVRSMVGEKAKGRSGDFARYGIEVKIVPVNRRGRLVERMSFPAFVHEELVFETWADSDLLGRLNRLLVIPVHREKKASLSQTTLGRPFFWSPTEGELEGISHEWEVVRALIAEGRPNDLPKASETEFIHARTHGRDSSDREQAPGGVDVTKKSFWLNDRYLERVLEEHDALTGPRPQ
jgi:DNA mismatch repair endonuclease MutH